MNKETTKKTYIWLLGNGAYRKLTDEEVKDLNFKNTLNNTKFFYEIWGVNLVNLAEVSATRKVELFLNRAWISTETSWQTKIKYTWIVIVGVLIVACYYCYGTLQGIKDQTKQQKEEVAKMREKVDETKGFFEDWLQALKVQALKVEQDQQKENLEQETRQTKEEEERKEEIEQKEEKKQQNKKKAKKQEEGEKVDNQEFLGIKKRTF